MEPRLGVKYFQPDGTLTTEGFQFFQELMKVATATRAGLMSPSDKTKLDGL